MVLASDDTSVPLPGISEDRVDEVRSYWQRHWQPP